MQIVTIAGALGKDAELKIHDGTQFCRFSVAVSTGWGERKATTWWEVTRWGKGADKLAGFLTKGSKVAVVGEVSTREHDGKTYLQVRADHVTLQGAKQADDGYEPRGHTSKAAQGGGAGGFSAGFGHDLSDEVPFLTMQGQW